MEINILILAYNEEEKVTRAIKSLEEQEYKKFNVTFIDDASTDNTYKVAKKHLVMAGIPHRMVKNTSNLGIIGNVKQALSFIKNKDLPLIRLDADDEFYPQTLKILVRHYEPDTLITGYYTEILSDKNRTIAPLSIFEALACGVLMPIDHIRKAGGLAQDDAGIFVEYDLFARMIKKGTKVKIIPRIIYKYYRDHISITSNKTNVEDSIELIRKKHGNKIAMAIRKY